MKRRIAVVGKNGRLGAALKQPQLFLELAVAMLQLFVLPRELPQLVFELLDPDVRIDVVGLRQRRRAPRKRAENNYHGQCRGTGNFM